MVFPEGEIVAAAEEEESSNNDLQHMHSFSKPKTQFLGRLTGDFPLESISQFLSHNPLVNSTSLEQTNERRLSPMQRHDILEKDPENDQMKRPGSANCIEDGDNGGNIHSAPFRNLNFWNHDCCRQYNAVKDEGNDVGDDFADEEEAVNHMNLLPCCYFFCLQ